MKRLSCLLTCSLLTLSLTGCGTFGPLGGTSSTLPATPAQTLARQETGVRLASGLATKVALLSLDGPQAADTAQIISTVSADIVTATANDQLDLTSLRTLAVKSIGDLHANPKQKLIAAALVDTLGALVQARVDSDLADLPATDRRKAVIGLIRAAAQGAQDATAIFATSTN